MPVPGKSKPTQVFLPCPGPVTELAIMSAAHWTKNFEPRQRAVLITQSSVLIGWRQAHGAWSHCFNYCPPGILLTTCIGVHTLLTTTSRWWTCCLFSLLVYIYFILRMRFCGLCVYVRWNGTLVLFSFISSQDLFFEVLIHYYLKLFIICLTIYQHFKLNNF